MHPQIVCHKHRYLNDYLWVYIPVYYIMFWIFFCLFLLYITFYLYSYIYNWTSSIQLCASFPQFHASFHVLKPYMDIVQSQTQIENVPHYVKKNIINIVIAQGKFSFIIILYIISYRKRYLIWCCYSSSWLGI